MNTSLDASHCVLPDSSLIQSEFVANGHDHVTVHGFRELGTTSGWLRERATQLCSGSGLDDVHVCVTDWQTAGVGQRSRSWQTKAGNITFSMLSHSERQAANLMGLSLVTGIAVVDCLVRYLEDMPGSHLLLKWPNDVILNGHKLGGLLTELSSPGSSSPGQARTQLLTGIGINLLHDDAVRGLGIGAISLEEAGVEPSRSLRDQLVGRLASAVSLAHQEFFKSGWQSFADRWVELDWLRDRNVTIHHRNSSEQAIARGVDGQGALLIERAGKILPLFSGNVSIRPTV